MPINMDKIGVEFKLKPFEHTPQTVELYHLGIGITDLEYVYEKNLKVAPSFAVVPAFGILVKSIGVAGVNPMMIVHGEQRIEIAKQPIPWTAKTVTTGKISNIYDKGKGALLVVEADTVDESGELLFRNIYSLFARGEGGFGGERGPGKKNEAPDRAPDQVVEYETWPYQHFIYRLSGDLNPLHADPDFAKLAGYPRPILHGLCTFGFVCRAIMEACCAGDPTNILDWEARFSGEVYPGDKIISEIWQESDTRVLVRAKTGDGREVLSNAAATLSKS
jgi:acyl dehydratase